MKGKGWSFTRRPTDEELAAEARNVVRTRASYSTPKMPVLTYRGQNEKPPSLIDSSPAVCAAKAAQHYTGTSMIGIATMHKSNSVPVFSQDDAVSLAKMRR